MKINFRYLLLLAIIFYIVVKWPHWGFPDCEDDANINTLKSSIARTLDVASDEIVLSEITETGLEDDGLGSDRFVCFCKASYKVGSRKGTIRYSVARDGKNYSTIIQQNRKEYAERIFRENEVEWLPDSSRAINHLVKYPLYKNPKESFKFFKEKPTVGSEYTIYREGSYDKYILTSLIQLNESEIPFDSKEALQDYKKFNIIFDFRKGDTILLYLTKPNQSLLRSLRSYSFELLSTYQPERVDAVVGPTQLLECDRSYAIEGSKNAQFLVLYNTEDNASYSEEKVNQAWEARLISDIGEVYRYSLFKASPHDIVCE